MLVDTGKTITTVDGGALMVLKDDGTFTPAKGSAAGALLSHPDLHRATRLGAHLTRLKGVTDTVAIVADKGDQVLNVTDGTKWADNDRIHLRDSAIANGNSEYDIIKIISIASNALTLDRPLDLGHPVGALVIGVSPNMALAGATSGPYVYKYSPPEGALVHVHAIHVTVSSGTEPSLERMGGNDPLTYGLHFRVTRPVGRDATLWIPFRTLNSMVLSGFKYEKETKVGTIWYARLSINLTEELYSVITLDQLLGEEFEVTLRDDNDTNVGMEVKLALHEEER